MKAYKDLTFETVTPGDIAPLTAVMRRAFDEDSMLHLGVPGGPPGYDNGDFLRRYALAEASTAYKISRDGRLIGGLILWINAKTGCNFLGTIFIDAPEENKGVGKTVWEFAQSEYPDTKVWRTETPIFSHRNHNFYVNKCGFHVVAIENPKDWREGSFKLEKRMDKTEA